VIGMVVSIGPGTRYTSEKSPEIGPQLSTSRMVFRIVQRGCAPRRCP
jgi:hypothetical protein